MTTVTIATDKPSHIRNWKGVEQKEVFAVECEKGFSKKFKLAYMVYSLSQGKKVEPGEFMEFLLGKFQMEATLK